MPHTLVTIPFSHFCEKARWALEAAGVAFEEEGHCPGLHRRAVRRAGGRQSVPVLVVDGGPVLAESSVIVKFADSLAPGGRKILPADATAREEALAFERRLDVELAPHVRLFVYFHVLPRRALTLRLFGSGVPRGERLIATVAFPLIRRVMQRFMHIDESTARDSADGVRRSFDRIGQLLGDGRPFLLGDRFGIADIAFAAFAAPVLLPAEHPRLRLELSSLPGPLADEVLTLRDSPAGRFALRLYKERRLSPSVEG